jgi:hypothetical protein
VTELVISAGETLEVIIETTRLRVRSLRDDDLADLVRLIDNWAVARWLSSVPHPYTEADGRTWIALVQQDHASGRPRHLAVALKETDRLIGAWAARTTKVKNLRSVIGWASPIGATGMNVKPLPPSSITAAGSSALKRSVPTRIQITPLRKGFSCTAV